jgi:tetratricopeptide (TPR) repeat protein
MNSDARQLRQCIMSSHPDPDSERHTAILNALQAQDVTRAVALARAALAEGHERALYLNLRAYDHEAAGRDAMALADLERAHALEPEDMQALNALGLAHARAGAFREALAAFSEVAARLPEFAPAHFNCGWASEELGELDAARASFVRAHEIDPANPEPLARLALLAVRLGASAEARARAERALVCDPAHTGARLAIARAELQEGNLAAAGRAARSLIDDPRTPPFERAESLGVLGDVLDAENKTSEAFAAWRARNAAVQAQGAARYARPAGETVPEYLGRLITHFQKTGPWRTASAGPIIPCAGHVFLLGFPRSGTTLLEEALARHPDVVTTQERDCLGDGVRELMNSGADLERLAVLGEGDAEHFRALYWQRLCRHGIESEGKVVIDKQPYNTINLPLIARLFPGARIVFSVRDPRDIVLSCFRRRFRMNASNYELLTLEGAASLYDLVMRLAMLYRTRLPLALLEVRHESLVGDFAAVMDRVAAFAGLSRDPSLREFVPRSGARAIVTPSAAQVAQGLRTGTDGGWRRYERELATVLPKLQPWVSHFGYSNI